MAPWWVWTYSLSITSPVHKATIQPNSNTNNCVSCYQKYAVQMHVILHLVCKSHIWLLIGLHIFTCSHIANVQLMTRKAYQWGDETKGGERIEISRDGHIPLVKGKRSECKQEREMGLWQGRWRGDVTPGTSNLAMTAGDGCSNSSRVTRAHTNVYTLLFSSKKYKEGEVSDIFMCAVFLRQSYLVQQMITWQHLMPHVDTSVLI